MNIVLLSVTVTKYFSRFIGAYQVAYYLRQFGHNVQVLDFLNRYNEKDLLDILDAFLPQADVIGLSTTFFFDSEGSNTNRRYAFNAYPFSVDVIDYIRRKAPQAKIVVGGGNSYKEEYKGVADAVVLGYGEQPFINYIKFLKGQNPFFVSTRLGRTHVIESSQVLPDFYDHRFHDNDLIFNKEALPIELSRGCIFKCSFCSYPANGKRKLDYLRDPNSIVGEIEDNYRRFQVTDYVFSDDTFNDSTQKLEQIAERLSLLSFKIKASAYVRLDLLAAFPEQLALLDRIGVHYPFFGVESMNKASRASIGKGADNDRLLDMLRRIKSEYPHWRTHGSFIIGLPNDTPALIYKGYQTIKDERLLSSVKYFVLGIMNKENRWASDLDKNPEKFGYTLKEERTNLHYNSTWTSNTGMTAQQANVIQAFIEKDLDTWTMMRPGVRQSLLSLDLDPSVFDSNFISDANDKVISQKIINLLNQYKQKLLSLERL